MAGRRCLLAIVAALGDPARDLDRAVAPAGPGRPEVHPRRPPVPDQPWPDVVRDTDQHPLYPALIAAAEPIVALFAGRGPDTWRIAAQAVAALASLALLFPLYSLTRSLFDERIACMAVAIYALLPIPAEVGHDTLSDSLGLLATLTCLRSVRSRCGPGAGGSPWRPGPPRASATWPAPR